jgi:hypothetical protein
MPKRKKTKRPKPTPAVLPGAQNPMHQAQTRKALRAHYAAKYRAR